MKDLLQKLMQRTFANEQDYQAHREELRLCLERSSIQLSGIELTMIEIAINEAMNNALKHGLAKTSDPSVSLSICLKSQECLLIRIKDRGSGFCARQALEALASKDYEWDEEWQWGESGRGLFIIESVMDHVRYNAKGNTVLMLKTLD